MTTPDIAARHAAILDAAQRTLPVDRSAILPEVREATTRLRADLFGDSTPLPDDRIPSIMFTMQPYGCIWERLIGMSMQLLGPECKLPRREQKLAILRTAWLLQAPYEWGEHVTQAHALGISPAETEAIATHGADAACWTKLEGAVLRACEELHCDAMLSTQTWDALAEGLSNEQIFELIVLIGQFTTVAYFQNAMRIDPEHGHDGLAAR